MSSSAENESFIGLEEGKDREKSSSESSPVQPCFCCVPSRFLEVAIPLLSMVLVCLAAASHWNWGIFLGILGICVGLSLLGPIRSKLSSSYSCLKPKARAGAEMCMHYFANLLFWYILLVTAVQSIPSGRVVSFEAYDANGFPSGCPVGSINCVRIGNGTDVYGQGAEGLKAPVLDASMEEVNQQIVQWVKSNGYLTRNLPNLVQGRFVTFLMGYVDDIATFQYSSPEGVVVNVQSQSRLGKGDMGKNLARVKDLLSFLNKLDD